MSVISTSTDTDRAEPSLTSRESRWLPSRMDADFDSHAVALGDLTRFPVGSTVWLGLIGLGGVVYAATLGTSERAQVQFVGLSVGSGLLLVSIGFLAALFVARRRDVRAVSLVSGDRPECACGGIASFYAGHVSGWIVLVTVLLAGFGIVFVPAAADGAAWGWLTPVVMGVVAYSLVGLVGWRGHEYVGVHADGIRVLRLGRLETAPWPRVLYFEGGQVGIEGKPDRAGLSDEVETRIKRAAIAAGLATFDERLRAGESIDLGAVTLQPSVLLVEGWPIRWDKIDSVTFEHDGENNWTHVVVRGRRRRHCLKAKQSEIAQLSRLRGSTPQVHGSAGLTPVMRGSRRLRPSPRKTEIREEGIEASPPSSGRRCPPCSLASGRPRPGHSRACRFHRVLRSLRRTLLTTACRGRPADSGAPRRPRPNVSGLAVIV
jgi:hypothetical protein